MPNATEAQEQATASVSAGEDAGELPGWFSDPVQRDRHSTLVARFDQPGPVQAEYARTAKGASGKNFKTPVSGKFGSGVELDEVEAQINFMGKGNLRPNKGTIQFWLRSKPGKNIWNDGRDHWFVSARAIGGDLQLRKDSQNRLRVEWGRTDVMDFRAMSGLAHGPDANRALAVPVSDLKPEEWHHLAFSWDAGSGQLWLAVDRKLKTLRLPRAMEPDDFYILFLGSSHEAGYDQRTAHQPFWLEATAGAVFDELKISDVSIQEIVRLRSANSHLTEELALRVEDRLRTHLSLIASLQTDGAWPSQVYAWPHMLPGGTSYRTLFHPGYMVSIANGRQGTPGAGMFFLYAYQVLGDRMYLEIARKAADWMLAAQQPEGYWSGSYRPHIAAPPTTVRSDPKAPIRPALYDGAQSQPALLLAHLYRELPERRWLEGFKKSADFLLKAQNPNGSWSHNYNVNEQRGENRHEYKQAGDFSNGIMHSQMTMMLVAYRLTGEKKYLDALMRAGDWVLAAQMGPPTYGWASHYDANNRPVWGRNFEPPGVSSVGGESLALFMYDLTGDRKFLDPVRKYLEWEKGGAITRLNIGGKVIEGRCQYYDVQTGRPIRGLNGKVYDVNSAEQRAALIKDTWANPRGLTDSEFPWLGAPIWASLEAEVNSRLKEPRPLPIALDRDQIAQSMPALQEQVLKILEEQNEAGVWTMVGDRTGGIGEHFMLVDYNPEKLLSLLERSRILSGELTRPIWIFPSTSMPYSFSLPTICRENWMDLKK